MAEERFTSRAHIAMDGAEAKICQLMKNVGNILGGVCDGEQVIIPRIITGTSVRQMWIIVRYGRLFLSWAVLCRMFKTNWNSLIIYTGTKKVNGEHVMKQPCNVVYKELFSDIPGTVEETTIDTTPVFTEEEEVEHGTSTIPESIFNITEEEAINMILPDYDTDFVSNIQ